MSLPHAVPWQDWKEWNEVRRGLFASHPSLQWHALQRIEAWSSRGRLPHSVASTAAVMRVQLLDAGKLTPISILQQGYAASIIRFVNGLADAQQTKARAQPVSLIAEGLGIPLWIVDLRHEATHNAMPSISTLRTASTSIVLWLRERYWDAQKDHLKATVDGVLEKLKTYTHLRMRIRKNKKLNDADAREFDAEDKAAVKRRKAIATDSIGATRAVKDIIPLLNANTVCTVLIPLLLDGAISEYVDEEERLHGGLHRPVESRPKNFLIPKLLKKFPATMKAFNELRSRWHAALVSFQLQWPHFSSTMLVELVKRLASEACAMESSGLAGGLEGMEVEGVAADPEDDERKSRRLYFLACWVDYFLSRDWVANMDLSSAQFDRRTNLHRRAREAWVPAQVAWMRSPAPFRILTESCNYPLIPIRELCMQQPSAFSLELFEKISSILGLAAESGLLEGKMDAADAGANEIAREVFAIRGEVTALKRASSSLMQGVRGVYMSEEEIAVLGDADAVDEDDDDANTRRLREMASFLQVEAARLAKPRAESALQVMTADDSIEATWTKVDSWDSCPIGTLRGGLMSSLDLPSEWMDPVSCRLPISLPRYSAPACYPPEHTATVTSDIIMSEETRPVRLSVDDDAAYGLDDPIPHEGTRNEVAEWPGLAGPPTEELEPVPTTPYMGETEIARLQSLVHVL